MDSSYVYSDTDNRLFTASADGRRQIAGRAQGAVHHINPQNDTCVREWTL